MKTRYCLIAIILLLQNSFVVSQTVRFRSGVFLHHSTGGCIWSDGTTTNVPNEISKYNSSHNLSGGLSVLLEERSWPETPWNNEWERWHRIFDNADTLEADIRPIIQQNKIVVIKSCFPSSSMWSEGEAADTLYPENKTLYNYKWHWRNFVRVMKKHPDNFFVVWTNAPLVASATNDDEAKLSHWFCAWAKDTLAAGLDKEIKEFPSNVYVFDFFHKLVGADWKLKPEYAANEGDSHPNSTACNLVAPQFVQEIFDAAIQYEQKFTDVHQTESVRTDFSLQQNYPNPFNPSTTIQYTIPSVEMLHAASLHVVLKVYNVLGCEVAVLVDENKHAGSYSVTFNVETLHGASLPSGVYFYKLTAGDFTQTKKLILMK